MFNIVVIEVFMLTLQAVVHLLSAPGSYLVLQLEGITLIGVPRLKGGGFYFKERGIIPKIFQNFVIFCFQITINNYHYDIKASLY